MAAFIEERNKRLVQAPDDRCSAMAALAIDACIDGQKKRAPKGPCGKHRGLCQEETSMKKPQHSPWLSDAAALPQGPRA